MNEYPNERLNDEYIMRHAGRIGLFFGIIVASALMLMSVRGGWLGGSPFWMAVFAGATVTASAYLFVYIAMNVFDIYGRINVEPMLEAQDIVEQAVTRMVEVVAGIAATTAEPAAALTVEDVQRIVDYRQNTMRFEMLSKRQLERMGFSRFQPNDEAGRVITFARAANLIDGEGRLTEQGDLFFDALAGTAISPTPPPPYVRRNGGGPLDGEGGATAPTTYSGEYSGQFGQDSRVIENG